MRIHDRYILRTVLAAAGVAAVVLVGISAFFVFLGELHDVGKGQYGLAQAVLYVLFSVPRGMYQLLPVIALLGSLMGLGGLAAGSELVVLRASGISPERLTVSALLAGLILAALAAGLGNWLGPRGGQLAQRIKTDASSGHVLPGGGRSVWVRNGSDYVHIGGVPQADRMLNVKIYRQGAGQTVSTMISARSAHYNDGEWHLQHVKVSRIAPSGIKVSRMAHMTWSGRIRPSLLRLFVVKPDNLSAVGLWRYAHYMKSNGISPGRYAQAFWRRIATPFTVLAMVLLSIPFVMGPLRSVGGGQRLFIGVLAGLVFFLANQILGNAGHVYGLAPWVVAWGPTLVLAAAGIWGLRAVD